MLEKLPLQSPNLVSQNIERIAALFPNCITETANGKAIDFDLLQQELNTDIIDGLKERYRLEWAGKREAIVTANIPTTKTLRPIKEDSVNFDTTQNLYIEGDNLEVLNLLQESYLSKVKMIYIDPPYNTGNDFVYKDNFTQSKDLFEQENALKDEYNQRLQTNPETSGRYHSDWLTMMYPRLKLARNLLTDDGVIFISIDDNEVHNLRKLCDEIFGEGNFVAQMIWSGGRKNDSKLISVSHEYLLCFLKSKDFYDTNKLLWREKKQGLDDIYSQYNSLKKKFKTDYSTIQKELKNWFKNLPAGHPAKNHSHYSNIDERGIYFASDISWPGGGGPKFEVLHPLTKKPVKVPSRGWLFSSIEKMQDLISQNLVHFGEDENSVPCLKSYLSDREYSVPYSVFYKDGRASSKRLMQLLSGNIFENPKDEEIIKSIVSFVNADKNSIILDFFSGSATTAHAVMQLNAEDGGNRKFIMVQVPEATDEKSEAYKAGYKNICAIGKERIRRAGKVISDKNSDKLLVVSGQLLDFEQKELTTNNSPLTTIDTGFRVYRLDSSNMQDVYYKPQDYKQENLDLFASNIKPDRTAEDLLTQVMLSWGLPLHYKIETLTIQGKQVFKVEQDSLFACFSTGIDEAFAKEIATYQPLRIVFKDDSFTNDTAKENVKQLLKQLSANTEMKVI